MTPRQGPVVGESTGQFWSRLIRDPNADRQNDSRRDVRQESAHEEEQGVGCGRIVSNSGVQVSANYRHVIG
jgi:hypothetical protein